jgi:2',3'-cyclic-nucleotide 3'-phosphodiesterase
MGCHPAAPLLSGDYPDFHPHITLASFPSTTTTSTIIASIPTSLPSKPQVKFSGLNVGDHFFRSVYLTIHPHPSLLALHDHLRCGERPPEFPHLSLFYITDQSAASRQERKEDIAAWVEEDGNGSSSVKVSKGDLSIDGFEADEIWVVDCDGPVEGWKVLHKVTMKKLVMNCNE